MRTSGRALITALPASRLPGAVPSAPAARLLARRLLEAGAAVRALVPPALAEGWPEGVEVCRGTVTDPASSPQVFNDVDRVFLAGLVSFEPERLRELTNLLLNGPLRRVVVLSSHGSDFESAYSQETWQWLAFERAMQLHDVRWVCVRPGGLFGNALVGGYPISGADWVATLAAGEPVREYLPDVAYPFLDDTDLADIATRLLIDDSADLFADPKLDVVGCLSSARDRLERIETLTGTRARLEPLRGQDEARAHWRAGGWPDVTIDVTLYAMDAFRHASKETRAAVDLQITTAETLLGRRTRTFGDWLQDNDAAFASAPSR